MEFFVYALFLGIDLYLFNKMFIHNAVGLVCLNAQPHDFSDYVGVRQV